MSIFRWFLCRLGKDISIFGILSVLLVIAVGRINAQDLYFIFNGPAEPPISYQVRYETRIYRFTENNRELKEVWTLGKYQESTKFGVYPSAKRVVIAGPDVMPKELYVFSTGNVENPTIITLDESSTADRFYYYQVPGKSDLVEIRYTEMSGGVSLRKSGLLSIDETGAPIKAKEADFPAELRLYGGRPSGAKVFDVITFSNIPIGDTVRPLKSFGIEITPVPYGIIQLGSLEGWVMIANEPKFYALLSMPDRNDLRHRELLLYDRLNGKWKSVMLDGGETSLRLINDWLVGRIIDVNPETDVEIRKHFPGICREETILINPMNDRQLIVRLGMDSQILWVENDTIYYKSGDRLFKSAIADDDVTDRKLLIADSRIMDFVWGFRGTKSDDDPVPDEVFKNKKAGD
jgi:hypothetical protein